MDFGWLEATFVRIGDVAVLGVGVVALAALGALAVGAAHALAPGHGKSIAAAALVAGRGRARDAVAVGVAVAVMHTLSVVVLGGFVFAAQRADLGTLTPWMRVASALLVLAVGIGLVVRQARARRPLPAGAAAGESGHGGRPDGHGGLRGGDGHGGLRGPAGDGDGHGRAHPHPTSRAGLVAIGLSGGLLPSPSAFLVLATAIFSGRAWFGLLLVVAFSVGLAATVTLIGLAVVGGREMLARAGRARPRMARLAAALPALSSLGVLAGGILATGAALLAL